MSTNAEEKKKEKGIVLQHIGKIRQFTVPAVQVLKVYRGTAKIDHPRFKKNIVITPGSVIDAVPELAEFLLSTRDFQKYGIDKA